MLFVQAEDGIRDGHVTGVQTCALPIFSGTSTSTPTTVARAAPEVTPKSTIAVATASSKKLEAPIKPAGAATLCGTRQAYAHPYAIAKMKNVWMVRGTAISAMCSGLPRIISP